MSKLRKPDNCYSEMESSSDVAQRSLNPAAPEFFPATRKAIFSLSLQQQTLPFPYTHVFSTPLFSPSVYHYPPHQHAIPLHFLTSEKAFAAAPPMTEPVSSLLEPLKSIMVELDEEQGEARKPRVMGRRRRNEDKHVWRYRRFRNGKEGFVNHHHSQSVKKEWRAKSSHGGGDKDLLVNRTADEASFNEYHARKVGNNRKREKHPPLPLKFDGNETTVMIRNIPNKYTRELLKEILDEYCMQMNKEIEISQNGNADHEEFSLISAFDFLYLPIDFITKSNKGYAFVNFTNPAAARKFFHEWHDKHWGCFKSNKIREIYCAKIQGIEKLVNHFEKMEFPSEEFQPLIFNPARDGSKQLVEEARVGKCTCSS